MLVDLEDIKKEFNKFFEDHLNMTHKNANDILEHIKINNNAFDDDGK